MKPVRLFLLFLLSALVLGGCVSPAMKMAAWPADIPDRSYFERAYELDPVNQKIQPEDEYLIWVLRFYDGYNGINGWREITDEVMTSINGTRFTIVAGKMRYLGMVIAAEWSKDSPESLIHTPILSAWSKAAREAARRGELEQFADRMTADVDAILSSEIDEDDITAERYYTNLAERPWYDVMDFLELPY